jgi:hypothetical protein
VTRIYPPIGQQCTLKDLQEVSPNSCNTIFGCVYEI